MSDVSATYFDILAYISSLPYAEYAGHTMAIVIRYSYAMIMHFEGLFVHIKIISCATRTFISYGI